MVRPLIGAIAVAALPFLIGAQPAAARSATLTATCAPTLPAAAAAPILTQDPTSKDTWHTTVFVLGVTGASCPFTVTLDVTPAQQPTVRDVPDPTQSGQQDLTITNLSTVPEAATLVLTSPDASGPSTAQLTISRDVGWRYYVGVPALSGVGLLLLFLAGLCAIRVYTKDPKELVASRVWLGDGRFWRRRLLATGSWTASDSWATNVGTVVAVAGGFTSLSASTAVFLPGVAPDRFAVLFIAAGAIIAATPLVFAVQYARWTARLPALTNDAVVLPTVAPLADIAGLADIGTQPIGTRFRRLGTGMLTLPAPIAATLPVGTVVTVPTELAPARLTAPADVLLPTGTTGTLSVRTFAVAEQDAVVLAAADGVVLRAATTVRLGDGSLVRLLPESTIDIEHTVATNISPARTLVTLESIRGVRPDGAQPCTTPRLPGVPVTGLRYGPTADVHAPSGASITGSAATTVCQLAGDPVTTQVGANQAITVPPESTVRIIAERIMLPGGTDLVTEGATLIGVDNDDHSGAIVISGSGGAADQTLAFPVLCWVGSGCKLTGTDLATVDLPEDAWVVAPGRAPRQVRQWPPLALAGANANQLVGTMRMVIVAALLTMFGIGAELGLGISLLALSTASAAVWWAAIGCLVVLVAFLVYYSATAVRTLADPQPGSSLSAASGTSFTL